MDTWIIRMCRKKAQRKVHLLVLSVIATAALLFCFRRYALNFLLGPFPMSEAELSQVANPDSEPHYFAKVKGDEFLDTGIQEVEGKKGADGQLQDKKVTSGFYATRTGSRFLIIKAAAKPVGAAAGELTAFSSDLSSQFFTGENGERLRSKSYPFYLDTMGFRGPGYWSLAIGLIILIFIAQSGREGLARLRDLNGDPLLGKVRKWGDPVEISAQIERELKDGVPFKDSTVSITGSYFIVDSYFSIDLFRLHDLLWAHKKVTKNSVNYIPTGKTYEAIFYCYGGNVTISGKEAQIDKMLAFAADKAPWAVLGWTQELSDLWDKKISEFCAAVEERRAA